MWPHNGQDEKVCENQRSVGLIPTEVSCSAVTGGIEGLLKCVFMRKGLPLQDERIFPKSSACAHLRLDESGAFDLFGRKLLLSTSLDGK